MSRPYEQAAARRRLPADNWLERRRQCIQKQQGNLKTAFEAIGRMGDLSLNGRISTRLVFDDKRHFDSPNPSQELRRVSIGVIPTGMPPHYGEHGTWTQNSAMGIDVDLKDAYDYSGPDRPRPLGIVSLVIGIHTWGRLSQEDTDDIAALNNTWVEYGDRGFSRRGTYVQVRREPDQKVTPAELDIILAPLSQHVIDYPEIMGFGEYVSRQPGGNFSDRDAERYEGEQGQSSSQMIASLGLAALPPELL
jgi:hypothetical protein